jgi:gamma-glutamyltranspeptidase/glutathione hydrolase
MKGAVAAGHPLTAEAGARILREGGNAVDACIAAGFVSWVVESPLTGPGGGGFLLVHRASDRTDTLLDFFVAVPGHGFTGERDEQVGVDISFDGRTSQLFLVGGATCAVPGTVAGLAEAHRLYASLPWPVLLEPAIELAEEGVTISDEQGFLHDVLDAVLRFGPEARRIYGGAACLRPGDPLRLSDLAGTLRRLADEGAGDFYDGELAAAIAACAQAEGGVVTGADLREYRVVRRRPVRVAFAGHEFVSNPPPSSGGLLISFALGVLDRVGGRVGRANAAEAARLAEVMREATAVRVRGFVSSLYRGGLSARVLGDERLQDAAERVESAVRPVVREPSGLPSTTHISVVDERRNAASLSCSTGCGSGIVVPGTGIHLNNMLGEVDLNPGGTVDRPGRRLTSMMAPSIALAEDCPRVVIGSAGSERLRGAILQTVIDVVGADRPLTDAIEAPRLHLDGERLHLEGGFDAATADELEEDGYDVLRWDERNLYFGGVAAVALGPDGGLEAAGDPRRGGAGIVVS